MLCVLQCVAVCCSVLQCVVLQYIAVYCIALQCVTVCCRCNVINHLMIEQIYHQKSLKFGKFAKIQETC